MLRICLLLFVLIFFTAKGQQKSKYQLQAEALIATNTQQAIEAAKKVFAQADKQKDYYTACCSGTFLGNAYRKQTNYNTAIYYDSLAVLNARQLQSDTLLYQKAVNSYARNFLEALQIPEAEEILSRDSMIFISHYSNETCLWYEMKALCSFNKAKIGAAIEYGKRATEVAEQIKDTVANLHARLMVFKFQSIFLKTDDIRSAFAAFTYFDSIRHHQYAAQAANIIGFAFETTHNTDKALYYYAKAYNSNMAAHNETEAIQTRMNMADALTGANQLEFAKNILSEGLQYFSTKNLVKNVAFVTLRLAKIYLTIEKYDSALIFFKLTDSLNKRLNNNIIAAGSQAYQALLQDKTGNFKERDSLASLVVNNIFHTDFKELLPVARQRLIDGEIGKLPDSIRRHKDVSNIFRVIPLQDSGTGPASFEGVEHLNWQTGANSAFDSTFSEKQSHIQLQADNEYKLPGYKDTIRTIKNENAGVRQRSSQLEKIVIVTTVFLILLGAGFWLQYKYRRRAERDRAQIEELQKEIHHRVTNNLGVINAMVEMAAKASTTQMPMSALKTQIDSVALVHRLLYSGTAAIGKISLQPYFEALSAAIAAIFERDIQVKITVDTPVETDSIIAEKLGLIVNELITNSFKYAFAEKENAAIHLYARQQKSELYLTVADNGTGLLQEAKKGYGSKLIKGLCHQLKGKYSYQNVNGAFFDLTVAV